MLQRQCKHTCGIAALGDAGRYQNGSQNQSVYGDDQKCSCASIKAKEATEAARNVYEELKRHFGMRRHKFSLDDGGK